MDIFKSFIKGAVADCKKAEAVSSPIYDALLGYLDEISLELDAVLKMTKATILFEGFYRSVNSQHPFKTHLLEIRKARWAKHFGTPTISFLLTYHEQIEQCSHLFKVDVNPRLLSASGKRPWDPQKQQMSVDEVNLVAVDSEAAAKVEMPAGKITTGIFIKTNNPTGGFTTTPCDLYSQKFIELAADVAAKGGRVLEIGAAFGSASLQALAKGATVFCNDIDPANLAVVQNSLSSSGSTYSGDHEKLVLVPGDFPDEISGLPTNYFDAILICRVLHFFSGNKIDESLRLMMELLKPGGKLFVVCETPYLKNWRGFLPDYEKRVLSGLDWPGEISNPECYESSGRASSLPKFVHWISREVLERSLIKSKLAIEHLSYIDRRGQFPEDLLLDGRESVGAIAVKRM